MKALKWIGIIFASLALLLLTYGTIIEPRLLLDTEHHQVEVPHLPPEWAGQTIALIADLQVGMWGDNMGMTRKAIRKIIAMQPALVVIAGDFVYKPDSAVVREAVSLLRPLTEAGLTTVAVLGNHDYSLTQDKDHPAEELASYIETHALTHVVLCGFQASLVQRFPTAG
jgi:hypothetical protein